MPHRDRRRRRASAGLAERWEHVAGRPLRVLEAPPSPTAEGADVVVVPGLGAIGYLLPFVHELGRGGPARLLDVPGFGHAATKRCPAALDDVRGVVVAWLAERAARPVVLVGHSTGAQAALGATVAVPDAVSALVLAGPTFPPGARRWRGLAAGAARTLRHESPRIVVAAGADYVRGGRGVLRLLRTAMADAPEDLVGRVGAPLVVLRGEHDAVCPPGWAAQLAGTAGDGRVRTVPGAHNFCFQAPGLAAAAVRAAAP